MNSTELLAVVCAFLVGVTGTTAVAWLTVGRQLRALQRSGTVPARPDETRRLERVEQALDALAERTERLDEGQEFTQRLLRERRPGAPAA